MGLEYWLCDVPATKDGLIKVGTIACLPRFNGSAFNRYLSDPLLHKFRWSLHRARTWKSELQKLSTIGIGACGLASYPDP